MEEQELKRLKQDYLKAIMYEDIEVAVRKGEAYYNALHEGEITAADREIIQNDIMIMKYGRE